MFQFKIRKKGNFANKVENLEDWDSIVKESLNKEMDTITSRLLNEIELPNFFQIKKVIIEKAKIEIRKFYIKALKNNPIYLMHEQ